MKWQEILSRIVKKSEVVRPGVDMNIKQVVPSRRYEYIIKLVAEDISLSSENLRWIMCALKGEDMPTFMKLMTSNCIFSGTELLERFKSVRVFRTDDSLGSECCFSEDARDRNSDIYFAHEYRKVWAEITAIEILEDKVVRECNVDLSQYVMVYKEYAASGERVRHAY